MRDPQPPTHDKDASHHIDDPDGERPGAPVLDGPDPDDGAPGGGGLPPAGE